MKHLFIVGALALSFLVPVTTYALTDTQISAVLGLMRSFGVDEAQAQHAYISLHGGAVLGATTIADDYGTAQVTDYPAYCPKLTSTFQRGARDRAQVLELQKFLSGHFDIDPAELVTGYFGSVTQQFVVRFQKEQGLPSFGIVGSLTRAKIAAACGGQESPQGTTPAPLTKLPPVSVCPAIAYIPAPCSGTLTPRYDTNGCQNGWICSVPPPTLKTQPVVTNLSSSLPVSGVIDGRLMRFSVAAQSTGNLGLGRLAFSVLGSGASVTNVGLYVYTDSGFSSPASGVGFDGSVPMEATSNYFSPVNPLQVPAGQTRYFELRGIVNASGAASVTATLLGDPSASGLGPLSVQREKGQFLWSPNSTTTSTYATNDWTNGYQVTGLPASGLTHTRSSGITPPPSSMTVTAPNGGEKWELGTTNTITWSPYGYNPDVNPSRDVKAYLERKEGTGYVVVGTMLPSGKASIHWGGDIDTYGKYPAPGVYYVRIVNSVTGQSDRSDAPFTILPKTVDLKVNGLDSGAIVADSQAITVSWTTANYVFSNGCTLSGVRTKPGGPLASVSVSANGSGTYYAFAPVAGSYTSAQLSCVDGAKGLTHTDYASYLSTPSTSASVRILTPNGGESLKINEPYTIRWSHSGLSKLSVALYKNDQWMKWIHTDQVATEPAGTSDGNYQLSWTPGGVEAEAAPLGSIFKIYITGTKADGSGFVDDKSDAPFSFVGTTPPPTPVTAMFSASPSSVTAGQSTTLSWSSTGTTNGGCYIFAGPSATTNGASITPNSLWVGSGSFTVTPVMTTVYTLWCTSSWKDGSQSVQKSITVSVTSTPTPPPPTGPGAVTSWKTYNFTATGALPCISGSKYIGYSAKYGVWVGALLCGSNTKYKLYMSQSETGTYYQIADYSGHGQDHCELVNPNFSIPNDDDITSGGCFSCAIGSLIDVQNETVFARARFGDVFKQVMSGFWGDLTTASYSCGVPIGTYTPPVPVPQSGITTI